MRVKKQPEPFVSLLTQGKQETPYPYFISFQTAHKRFFSDVFFAVRPIGDHHDMKNIHTFLGMCFDHAGVDILSFQPLFTHSPIKSERFTYHVCVVTKKGYRSLSCDMGDPLLCADDLQRLEESIASDLGGSVVILSVTLLSSPFQQFELITESLVV